MKETTMIEKYEIRVNGRLYEISHGKERAEEITKILSEMYGKEAVTCRKLRKNSNLYKWH
jgi:hypothetical protein